MYYKITIDDAIGIADRLNYIREQENGIIVRCRQDNANGITFDGTNYHVDGLPAFPTAEYDTVTVEEITRAEYLALADELGVEVAPSVEDGALALARADYIAMMTGVEMEEIV